MRKSALVVSVLFSSLTLVSCHKKPSTEEEKTLYSFGTKLGSNLKNLKLSEKEMEMIAQGFRDSALDQVQKVEGVNYEEPGQAEKIQKFVETKRDSEKIAAAKVGKEFYDKFLASGAVKTESGLAYQVVKQGEGISPSAKDLVEVHYQASLPNGKVIQSTKSRGEPSQLPVDKLLKGWSEGIQLMRVGGQTKMVLPPELAYGDYGNPPDVPGGSYLVLEVELLSATEVKAPDQAPATKAPVKAKGKAPVKK